LIVPGNFPFNYSGFEYLAAEKFPRLRLTGLPLFVPSGNPAHRHPGTEILLDSDYYLIRRGDINGNRDDMHRFGRAVRRFLEWDLAAGGRLFERIATIPLPNGTPSEVYRLRRARSEEMILDGLDWVNELDPDDPSVSAYLESRMESGVVSREVGAALLASLESGGVPGAERDQALARLVERAPGLRWGVRLRAERRAELSESRAAADLLEILDGGTPYLTSPYETAGDRLLAAGDERAAGLAYERAVADRPDEPSARRKLARVLRESGEDGAAAREEEIADLLERMRRFNPRRDTASFRLRLGDLARLVGRIAEARHHYSVASENVPGSADERLRLLRLDREGAGPATRRDRDEL
jgi:tetratricopeptide (TPR) repeat protein